MEGSRSVRIVNARGLHARPCHALARAALRYRSDLRITCAGQEVDGKSILELLTLCAGKDDVLLLRAQGDDAEELLDHLVALVGTGFQEPD